MPQEQQRLFELPAPWEQDDQAEVLAATVVFPRGPAGPWDYRVPDALRGKVEPGRRVRAPLGKGNRSLVGYCVQLATRPEGPQALKPLSGVIDERPLLSPAMCRLTQWIAEHYLCDWAQVLEAAVPGGVRVQAGTRLAPLLSVAPDAARRLSEMALPPKQLAVLKMLAAAPKPLTIGQLAHLAGCTSGPITALRKKGLILSEIGRATQERGVPPPVARQANLVLNPAQQAALAAIHEVLQSRRHQTILIHGVTGSGKTEVYLQAVQEVIGFGRQAIVLVPEISLTPQTLERFAARFDRVAVLHSHLSDAERHGFWQEIAQGRVQVVVGARSAVFAPTPHLGLIVLDEEHEFTFKQEITPRYHARDVARARAEAEGVPLVLGSATPSLESWQRAQSGQYRLVEMPRRVLDRPLPPVCTIDLRDDVEARNSRGAISRPLHAAMHAALAAGGQVILLLNRRGFSTHIQCHACGQVVRCPHCEIALTHHRAREIALCHYCDYEIPSPTECPHCKFTGIRYSGRGTQRLEAEVKARFPGVPCLRMDTDAMQGRDSHARALAAFRSGEVKILLGTQMIAKGLDFPNVTLVGVINADTALHFPDFRAAERTFHLLTQVAGRTGRSEKGGRVMVQTFNPDNPAIVAATRHDYAAFAKHELPMREMLGYPPFGSMIRLVVRGPTKVLAWESAKALADRLREAAQAEQAQARVLGPAPAPFAKLRGNYRFQIQVQGPDADRLRAAVRRASAHFQVPDEVQWIADVDPVEML